MLSLGVFVMENSNLTSRRAEHLKRSETKKEGFTGPQKENKAQTNNNTNVHLRQGK